MKVQPKQYAKLIFELTETAHGKEALDKALARMAAVIKDNKDQGKIDRIIAEFEKLYKDKNGIVEGQVISAKPLEKGQLKNICAAVAGKFNTTEEKVSIEEKVDEKIKGGLVLKIENEVWDGSVQSKLQKLMYSLQK